MLLRRMKTTNKAPTAQLRTCKLCDRNGFTISSCLLCLGHLFLNNYNWEHWQLVVLIAHTKKPNKVAGVLLHSSTQYRKWWENEEISQTTRLKYSPFSWRPLDWRRMINSSCERKRLHLAARGGGGKRSGWVLLSASKALLSDLHEVYWSDMRRSGLAFFPWWHCPEENNRLCWGWSQLPKANALQAQTFGNSLPL